MRNWPVWPWTVCSRFPEDRQIARAAAGLWRRLRQTSSLLLFFLAVPVAHAADVSVKTTRHGDRFDVTATAEIGANSADAWKVLTDYDRLAEFIPGVLESRVLSRNGLSVLLDQRGETRLLFLRFPMYVRLAIEEFPPDRIVSRAVAGNFKELHGVYYLQSRDSGVQLRFEGGFTPDFGVPPLIGTLLVGNAVERRFIALVREIEKKSGPAAH